MSVADFEGMDSDEFSILCDVYGGHEDQLRRDGWERARIVGTLAVSPYVKGSISPRKILPLPWDKVPLPERGSERQPALSREEDMKALEDAMKAMREKTEQK